MALAIWLVVAAAFAVSIPGVRRSIPSLVKSLLQPAILGSILLLAAYVALVVWGLQVIGFWNAGLLKDTVLWFLLVGVVAPFSLIGKDEVSLVRLLVVDNVKIFVLLEFLVNVYTFSLPVELIIIPTMTLVAMMDVVAEQQPESANVSKLLKGVQAVFGLIVLTYVVWRAVADYQALASLESVRQVVLPLVLSIAYVPAAFMFSVWIEYDNLFLRLRVGREKSTGFERYAKLRLIRHFGPRPNKIKSFLRQQAWPLSRATTKEELEDVLCAPDQVGNGGNDPNAG